MRLADIYLAKRRVGRWARRTPMTRSKYLGDLTGGDVLLKLENQQLTGSFKIRGAANKLLTLKDKEKGCGVVTASSGNHAQGLGYIARELGIGATIVVPENTPRAKIKAIMEYNVDLIIHGEEYMDAESKAYQLAKEHDSTYVSAYNDSEIIAGQGTVGLEMLEERPELDYVLVPIGGGGLISGIATVWKEVTDAEIIGVQSVASPVMYERIRKGEIVELNLDDSYAEGLHGGIEAGSVTFDICQKLVDDFILVREDTILDAIYSLILEHRLIVEGAGAVGVAAVMENPRKFMDKNVGIVISGGNIDSELLKLVICR
jgi:threonine dehydratase